MPTGTPPPRRPSDPQPRERTQKLCAAHIYLAGRDPALVVDAAHCDIHGGHGPVDLAGNWR